MNLRNSAGDTLPPSSRLPLNAAFFSGINLTLRQAFIEKVALDVVEEKILRVDCGEIQPVVIDDLRLLL